MAWWPLGLYRVAGKSMEPTYSEGDVLLGWRWFKPAVNQVVVAQVDRLLVKRIDRIDSAGIWLVGDNPDMSTDSRTFGAIDHQFVHARIIARISRAA